MLNDPYYAVKYYRKKGVAIGQHVRLYNVKIDARRPFLVEIGDNVILTNCRILTHDASTSIASRYTKIGHVKIGSNVFVGVGAVILPNVEIGDNVIVGAGTIVSKSIPSNAVVVGCPQRIVGSFTDYVKKNNKLVAYSSILPKDAKNKSQILQMRRALETGIGFVESPDSVYNMKNK